MNYILNDTIIDCRSKYFHSFEHKCVYDIIFINIENMEEVILLNILEYKKDKSQFCGLSKKNVNARNKGFIFVQIVKLTK